MPIAKPGRPSLALFQSPGEIPGDTKTGRLLQTILRDTEVKKPLFQARKRNEEVLSLVYHDYGSMGVHGGDEWWVNVRESALNLPYRHMRWFQAQATSKKMIVNVGRDAGKGQKRGGPGDEETGMWQGILLERVARIGGFRREMNKVIAECEGRGTSVIRIGYHEEVVSPEVAAEAGKDATSVLVDVLEEGDLVARDGQDHANIAKGLQQMSDDAGEDLGPERVNKLLERAESHIDKDLDEELDDSPTESTRMIRRRVWMQQLRVGEDVGWAPWVTDTEDTPLWWQRHTWSKAQVKAADKLFAKWFRESVEGYDARHVSGLFEGARAPSSDQMGEDAKLAQSEGILEDDERVVEFFEAWFRRPDMKSGGYRKIVCPEFPDRFVERDDRNPFVDDEGNGLIEGFYPFYDFTPIQSSMQIPERTCGIPMVAPGMTQFEKIKEYNKILQESALKSATSLLQLHPGVKNAKNVMDAINEGRVKYAFVAPPDLIDSTTGKMDDAVIMHHFSGTHPEIYREVEREKLDCLNMLSMPPAVYQGMGTADTLGQDRLGVASGERETGATLTYFEDRMGDVLSGMRGLVRGNYDREDFVRMLGEVGAAVITAWQKGSVDDGDDIDVTFGARAQAQEIAERKQLMEAISLLNAKVDPVTQIPLYDDEQLVEELHRSLDLGAPKRNEGVLRQLQELVLMQARQIEALTGQIEGAGPGSRETSNGQAGPRPSEGEGPTEENITAGALRDTLLPTS